MAIKKKNLQNQKNQASPTESGNARFLEAALQESEERFRAITDNASIVIFLKDTTGRYIHVNQHYEKIFHVSLAAIKGKTDNEIFPRDIADVFVGNDQMVIQSGQPLEVEEKVPHDDGIHTYISVKFPLRNVSGEISAVCGIATDITERKKIEEALQKAHDELERRIQERTADLVSTNERLSREIKEREQVEADLRESERKYRTVVETTGTGFVIISDQGKVLDANLEYVRQTGHSKLVEIAGGSVVEWTAAYEKDKNIEAIKQCMRNGYIRNLEIDYVNTFGSIIPIEINATVLRSDGVARIFTISRDITERKKHEKEQMKMEKLESLGILAGGIAHDFNNILTGIMGNISFAQVFLDETHKSYKPLAEAEKATVRAGELAHQLLTFARGGEPIKKVVSPLHLVLEALSFILHGSKVKSSADIPDSVHAIEADAGQISQVFQNIIINAAQAMPGGGILTVTARNEELSENNTLSLPPGTYIRLSFADQGCGISEEDLRRIFDPYFTTKSAGIGLGLSSAYSIVSRHDGHIGVTSAVGKGTTFTIHLPSTGKEYTEYRAEAAVKASAEHKGGSILVMDDDEMIRDIASSMLTHLGYQVTVCANGEEAVKLYKASMESGAPFSLAIMDLTIPGGLGGKEAAEQILSFFPKARLVVSSGYSNDPILSDFREYGFSGAIAKPYNIHKFKEALVS